MKITYRLDGELIIRDPADNKVIAEEIRGSLIAAASVMTGALAEFHQLKFLLTEQRTEVIIEAPDDDCV